MKSLLEEYLLSENRTIVNEFDVQYSINDLRSVLENAERLERKVQYTAESVPIFAEKVGNHYNYVIEDVNLRKFMECQHIDVATALSQIKEVLNEEAENKGFDYTITSSDLYILINKENMDQLEKAFFEDPSNINIKYEAVNNHVNYLNSIVEEGAKVLFITK